MLTNILFVFVVFSKATTSASSTANSYIGAVVEFSPNERQDGMSPSEVDKMTLVVKQLLHQMSPIVGPSEQH